MQAPGSRGCQAALETCRQPGFGDLCNVSPGLQPHFLPACSLQPSGIHPACECCWKGSSCSPSETGPVGVREESEHPRELPGDGATLGTFPWHKVHSPLPAAIHSWLHTASWSFVTAWKYSQRKFDLFFLHLEGDRNPFSVSIPWSSSDRGRRAWLGSPRSSEPGMCLWEVTLALLPRAEPRKQVDVPGKFN